MPSLAGPSGPQLILRLILIDLVLLTTHFRLLVLVTTHFSHTSACLSSVYVII